MKKFIHYSLILSIVLVLSLFINFKVSDKIEVHASGPKIFEVNDVLPATTQLRISWNSNIDSYFSHDEYYYIKNNLNDELISIFNVDFYINNIPIYSSDSWISPYESQSYIDLDTTSWSSDKRTIKFIEYTRSEDPFSWEDLAPAPSGYTITFNSNGGSSVSDIEEATELPDPLPIPTKSGYTFGGWYYDDDFTTQAYAEDELEDDVTLYAKWILNTYTITYNSNGGSNIPQTSDATQLPNPLPIPTRTGYYFQGWFYDSDFTNEALAGDSLTSDVTLYAMWTQYNRIFFNTNGGNTIPTIITTDIIPDNLPIPERNNDIFIGWYYDESLSDPVESNDIISSNITLYASWIDYDGIVEYFYDIYKDGFDDGYDDTYEDAFNQGYELGFPYGYPYGYDDGYQDGLMEDHPIEFSVYFDKGFFDAREKYGKLIDDYQWESAQIAYENGQKTMGRYSKILMYGIVIITIIGGVILYYSLKRRNQ
jgi:uncharacterized repeat protein (TIGR02543 family)